jgi:hypothetical protein
MSGVADQLAGRKSFEAFCTRCVDYFCRRSLTKVCHRHAAAQVHIDVWDPSADQGQIQSKGQVMIQSLRLRFRFRFRFRTIFARLASYSDSELKFRSRSRFAFAFLHWHLCNCVNRPILSDLADVRCPRPACREPPAWLDLEYILGFSLWQRSLVAARLVCQASARAFRRELLSSCGLNCLRGRDCASAVGRS